MSSLHQLLVGTLKDTVISMGVSSELTQWVYCGKLSGRKRRVYMLYELSGLSVK